MRPGYRRRRPWWRRWRPAWWHEPPRPGPPRENVVLVLAVLCGLLAMLWVLSVLGP